MVPTYQDLDSSKDNNMQGTTLPSLTPDLIDDVLYLARIGDLSELQSTLSILAKTATPPTTQLELVLAAIDEDHGNGALHMACANGHTGQLDFSYFLSSDYMQDVSLQELRH